MNNFIQSRRNVNIDDDDDDDDANDVDGDGDGDTGIGGHGHNHDHEYAANLYLTASLLKDVAVVPRAAGTGNGPGHIHVLGDESLLGT